MEVIGVSSIPSVHLLFRPTKNLKIAHIPKPNSILSPKQKRFTKTKLFTAESTSSSSSSSTVSTKPINPVEQELETETPDEKYDWFSQWYPVMPVCDLDKRKPTAKKVMGIDVVVWWDKNESAWKVFEDKCPHRLAPLSEGRIDQWGRLQCVYHGWCFSGSGDCKFIPQAPPDGPPVNTFKNACVSVYPSVMQNDMVWFWPNSDPQYKDILMTKKPPYFPELDDPSYTCLMGNRDIPYGYEVLIENLMDPSHVPYAHYGIMPGPRPKNSVKADREGGRPYNMSVQKFGMDGFVASQEFGGSKFIPPCIFHGFPPPDPVVESNGSALSTGTKKEQSAPAKQRRSHLIFIAIPVSPGYSRLIWVLPRNFELWIDRVVPRWMFHVGQNLILDSDMYLLHVQEHNIMNAGASNWQKVCFVPTKADALVVGFRRWINKYSGGQIDWGTKFGSSLPPTPRKDQLMDRYWSHVVNCKSCNAAYKGLKALEVALQVVSVAAIAVLAAAKQTIITSMAARITLVSMAILSFAASKWLSHFIYKNFHFHDYNHAFR